MNSAEKKRKGSVAKQSDIGSSGNATPKLELPDEARNDELKHDQTRTHLVRLSQY